MRILHILDHSPPRKSDYSRRVMAILRHQRALGWKTCQLTGPAHGSFANDDGGGPDDWHFFRTSSKLSNDGGLLSPRRSPSLTERIRQVVQLTRPDILHAHSPAALAFAAIRVGRHAGLPVLFEAHAPAAGSPDGASWMSPWTVGHGRPQRMKGLGRHWLDGIPPRQHDSALARFGTRTMEAWAARRAGAVVTNSEGMRQRLLQGGVPAAAIHILPDAVEAGSYRLHGQCRIERRRHSPELAGHRLHGACAQLPAEFERRTRTPDTSPSPWGEGRPVVLGFSPAQLDRHCRAQAEFDVEAMLDSLLTALALLNKSGATVRLLFTCGQTQHAILHRAATRHGLATRPSMQSSEEEVARGSSLMELYAEAQGTAFDASGGCASAGAPATSAITAGTFPRPAFSSLTAVLHARADIMVFPQRAINSAAGPPRQLLQAMARGCVVAAANTAAHREVIEHGRNGVLFEPDDAGALADAVKVLLDGAPRWPDMRASARWLIDYHRNWEGCVGMYGPIYEKLMAGRRRR